MAGEAKRRAAARAQFEALPAEDRLGDAPVEAEHYEQMQVLAYAIDELFNGKEIGEDRKTRFVLMVFSCNELDPDGKGRCNYISNGINRRDIVVLMREMIARFEGQPEVKGSA